MESGLVNTAEVINRMFKQGTVNDDLRAQGGHKVHKLVSLPLLCALQAAKQVAAEQEAGARSRAEAMLQADMPQEALEALMRDIFRSADTDGSGALSRAVRIG